MEIPTARVMEENSYRIGAAQVDPYRYYYISLSPLKRLEINGRITEVLGVQGFRNNNDYGNYKDKAIDLKYQFIPEGKYVPALAIGIMDPHGTRVYPSQYLVASKQIYPFDFTIGLGNGRFGKTSLPSASTTVQAEILSNPSHWLSDSQFFWGVQFAPTEKFALALEYSPIQYHSQTRDPAQPVHFKEQVPSEYNFGIRYKPTKWSEVDLSYQRGNQIGINLSMAFDIGEPLIPLYDRIYREDTSDILDTPSVRITRILHRSGFSDIGIDIDGDTLWIEAQNDKYFYPPRAAGVIIQILADKSPGEIENINIILKENGIPVIQFTTTRDDIIDLHAGKMTMNEFLQLSNFSTGIKDTLHARGRHKKLFGYGLKPEFRTFLNDPSGFFKYKLGVKGWIKYHPWKGLSFITGLTGYALNNISTSNEPLSMPVRSDIVLYEKEKVALDRVMFTQVKTLFPSLYGSISAGLLELQYAGVDAEIATPVLDGRIYLGISGSAVKKRSPDNPLELQKNPVKDLFTTTFFKTRINIPEKEIAIDIKAGEFLAGDRGVRFEISKYIKGVTLRAWYTSTDTSIFTDSVNDGYHDKGIGISIPLRLFKGSDSRTAFKYLLSPWTRDSGQDIDHFSTLFDFIGRKTKIFLDKDKKFMYN
ncbi:MAG TPA: hypothetical protein ENH50_07715 [Nitrospirae bacterium]|nr:hypothetical protein [Nitrospirota bacterium]